MVSFENGVTGIGRGTYRLSDHTFPRNQHQQPLHLTPQTTHSSTNCNHDVYQHTPFE